MQKSPIIEWLSGGFQKIAPQQIQPTTNFIANGHYSRKGVSCNRRRHL